MIPLSRSYLKSHLESKTQISFNLNSVLQNIKQRLELWQHNYQSRKQLALLNADQLRDIGLTLKQAKLESEKVFWR
ncbi:DUF1127 domain-containing protein [Neptuniibacter marinus]|uniref:DUF1127 domain-containing protein n=1 Tax=Neptuniibacter marinus TaxID=1806670 RepID=UPI000833CB93